jgi:hypothetical protein
MYETRNLDSRQGVEWRSSDYTYPKRSKSEKMDRAEGLQLIPCNDGEPNLCVLGLGSKASLED